MANYDPELVPEISKYPVDEVYGKFPADGVAVPIQPAIQQGFAASLIEESRTWLHSSAGTRRSASCEDRFAQHGLEKCLLPGLCRLYANSRVFAEPRRVDPFGEPRANRPDVR